MTSTNSDSNGINSSRRSILILYGSQTGTAREVAERLERMARRRHFDRIECKAMDTYLLQQQQEQQRHMPNTSRITAALPSEPLVCFVCSTTGQGECPDNMSLFWRALCRRSLPASLLRRVRFAVCGLGDSAYDSSYNFVGKRLYRRMLQLGATELCRRADCDDQHPMGFEGELAPWMEEFWTAAMRQWPLQPGLEVVPEHTLLPPSAHVEIVGHTTIVGDGDGDDGGDGDAMLQDGACRGGGRSVERTRHGTTSSSSSSSSSSTTGSSGDSGSGSKGGGGNVLRPLVARVAVNQRLTPEGHWQDVRHMELELESVSGAAPLFVPGDVLAIMPKNPQSSATRFAQLLGLCDDMSGGASVRWPVLAIRFPNEDDGNFLTMHDRRRWQQKEGSSGTLYHIPLMELLGRYLDIMGVPNKYFFEVLSHFVMDPDEAGNARQRSDELEKALDRLQYFASAEGTYDMYRYAVREKRSHVEVLEEFAPYVHTDRLLPYLLDIVPRLQARSFSISSSPSMHPSRVHITVAVAKFTTPMRRTREGLCSTWLRDLPVGATLPVWFRQGTLRLPASDQVPLVMVGPGTGMAPFRSFYQERWMRHRSGAHVAQTLLFFGNRNRECDFLYGDEMVELQQSAGFFRLFTAFSRDQEQKIYVQHEIKRQSSLLWRLLQAGATVYIAGNAAQMPKDVKEAIAECIVQESGMTQEEALKYIKTLEQKKRYVVEAW